MVPPTFLLLFALFALRDTFLGHLVCILPVAHFYGAFCFVFFFHFFCVMPSSCKPLIYSGGNPHLVQVWHLKNCS
uniref:Uncharacterized protein n=1 Tax=Ixodes ricinus TaxID=34613 RepID=A0A147BG28_IXORI